MLHSVHAPLPRDNATCCPQMALASGLMTFAWCDRQSSPRELSFLGEMQGNRSFSSPDVKGRQYTEMRCARGVLVVTAGTTHGGALS